MAMERHPRVVQRPLYRQVELGESLKHNDNGCGRYLGQERLLMIPFPFSFLFESERTMNGC
jgi:hypothetical protein